MKTATPKRKVTKKPAAKRSRAAKQATPAHEVSVVEEVKRFVREEPWKALAGAAVAGLVVRRLPLGLLAGGGLRLMGSFLKPSIVALLTTELYRLVEGATEPKKHT